MVRVIEFLTHFKQIHVVCRSTFMIVEEKKYATIGITLEFALFLNECFIIDWLIKN